ncbi:lysophospholipid acyltransferase family protein [Nocardioides coralli]|uniref:lysophospholipid acyltransferase family protein n=1 Tax=Nocardioides coralli TaxID=2872154 RepID=UPI001CA3CB57|nr:lysophospholipid acyltransferase family protein [Nocardioides coralli]QZY29554.1 1-acyl-sn-glycerol-3-phosphate acyltransferase [Nocardioides coralli]
MPDDGWYRATVLLGRLALRAVDLRTSVEGAHHLPASGPVILAATHVAYPDFLTLAQAALTRGRRVRFLTRHDVWDVPVVGRAMTGMRHVPVDREAPAAAYLGARRLLREGEAVGVFPEAGISYSYTVRSLMPGVARLAQETGAPVVPVVQWGIQRLWSVARPVDGRQPRPRPRRGIRNDLRFGPPLRVPPTADPREWTARLGGVLTELLEDLQRRPHHRPRPGEHAPWYPAHLGGHAPDRVEARGLDVVPRSAVPPSWGPAH